MAYTTIDKPTDYFNTVLRNGLYGGSDTAFTVGFQPDWIWDKRRSGTSVHALFDSVRGFGSSGKVLYSNTTDAEATNGLIDSVSSTGFTIKASADNTGTLVDWCWKAGGSASSNTDGSITSNVSASTTSGFSIVSYTGTGSASTIGHGLNSTPSTIILKNRINGSVFWYVYHKSLGNNSELYLNGSDAAPGSTGAWNTTSPTSSVFSVGSHGGTNASGQGIIAYCFAEKKGFSKFGSYTGNGNADGTFVYTGFKPAFVLQKCSSSSTDWTLADNKRPGYNEINKRLVPNESAAEATNNAVDFLSNGFKCRQDQANANGSGETYIYMAFAESPFVTSTGIPTTAR